jgi:hypothetical protein
MLAVYRAVVAIPTPGIDGKALAEYFDQVRDSMLGLVNLFSGGALEQFSIAALGIMPYISASIILQLMTVVIPHLERLSKEGEVGGARSPSTPATAPSSWPSCKACSSASDWRSCRRPAAHRWSTIRVELPDDERDHARVGHGVPHVARRADLRARHRQRHFADHLRRHRRQFPLGDADHRAVHPRG